MPLSGNSQSTAPGEHRRPRLTLRSRNGPRPGHRAPLGLQSVSAWQQPTSSKPSDAISWRRPEVPVTSPCSTLTSTKPVLTDRTESLEQRFRELSLISRATEPLTGEETLTNPTTQDNYYGYLEAQLQAYADKYGWSDCPPPANPNTAQVTPQRQALVTLVGSFRKLREGLTASRRVDTTAVAAYERSVEVALLAHDHGELRKAFCQLLEYLYPVGASQGLAMPRRTEISAYYYINRLSQVLEDQTLPSRSGMAAMSDAAELGQTYLELRLTAKALGTDDKFLAYALQLYSLYYTAGLGKLADPELPTLSPFQRQLFKRFSDSYRLQLLQIISSVYYSLSLDDLKAMLAMPSLTQTQTIVADSGIHAWCDCQGEMVPVSHQALAQLAPRDNIWFKKRPTARRPTVM
ncbi:hypothetical protein H4R34_000712 [Dimargaris verticillata]|uniref:Uncharacterized protein n=1 Tax=Dimargaris verticillata TaxID=2761393 RepID=A0A9W8EF48_9FUNG|nr:hypothetical protein H4R34_000712 [Dimargaris verticillata]